MPNMVPKVEDRAGGSPRIHQGLSLYVPYTTSTLDCVGCKRHNHSRGGWGNACLCTQENKMDWGEFAKNCKTFSPGSLRTKLFIVAQN